MSAAMKMKTLQGVLQELRGFEEPKVEFEQYETPAHIAAVALYTIQTQFDALDEKLVLDAGCGPGALSIGAALLGATVVTAVEVDGDVIQIFKDNVDELEATNIDAVLGDFLGPEIYKWENYFDTVLMNPPFGTKNNAGVDMKFLKKGLDLSCDSVFSLHKSTTRSHIKKKVNEWGVKGSVIAELRYDLPATYKFHRQQSRDIAVDLWHLQHPHA
ncbi:rRNA N6-adenosine-methyltransferase Mettl5 [Pectinophora gossypiella]|uniref:Methyltransferase small domain-containing protein n=1 Tax=Pectinophora gossypiella TaxID=13191 RepID=A0A1E1WPD0_PECGO|nr:rRNA N6-adenosine-methyltransferase Mettl5 [Pectinophora gossypiella]